MQVLIALCVVTTTSLSRSLIDSIESFTDNKAQYRT